MERKKLNQELGFYQPAFFKLKYNLPYQLNDILNRNEEAIFIHEYIHFLQDLTTPYGNANLCNVYNNLRVINDYIRSQTSNEIKLPLQLKYSENVRISNEYSNYVNGFNEYSITKIDEEYRLGYEKKKFKDKEVTRHYFYKDKVKYYFGAIDILENHAYLIERELWGDNFPAPEIPYKTAEIIANSYSEWIYEDKEKLATLLELSLNTTNPADFYINILSKIKNDNYRCDNIDDFIQYVNEGMLFESSNLKGENSLEKITEFYNNEAIKFAKDSIKSDSFVDGRAWLDEIFKKSLKNRLLDPALISRGLIKKEKKYYFDLMNEKIGLPIIFNGLDETFIQDSAISTNQIVLFPAILEIIKLFTQGDYHSCSLKNACEKSNEIMINYNVDDKCDNSPWEKVKEYKMCPLSIMLYSWGLSKYNYKKMKR